MQHSRAKPPTFDFVEPAEKRIPLRPPDRPWKPGVHDYKCFRIRVFVAETGDAVWSDHEPESPEDEAVFEYMISGGLRQASYALFTEALRKETVYTVLLKLQNDPEYKGKLEAAASDPKKREEMEEQIATAVGKAFLDGIRKNGLAIAREAIEGILIQAGAGRI